MTEKKKLTTAEILAMARKQASGGEDSSKPSENSTDSSQGAAVEPTSAPTAEETSTADETSKPLPAAPKSTADILAAARAQGSGAKQEPKKPAKQPGSTADILAAARAQGGGGAKPAPKSTADILAAARAQAAGGAKSAAAKPAAEKPVSAKKTSVEAPGTGERPALKEMVAAVKEAKQTGVAAKPKLPAGSPSTAKPKLPKKAEQPTRRGMLAILAGLVITPFVLAWSAVGLIGAIWSLGIARFMMPNMVLELPSKFKVGPPGDFPPGTVSEKFKASRGIWIVNTDEYDGRGKIYALLSICTHLGCTPSWLEGEQKFKCPCHGSGFYISGINFEGPAPRPLERVGIRLAEDGMLEVDKSLKFQEELGQWSDPKSFELA